MSVLVIEDDPSNSELLARLLARAGCRLARTEIGLGHFGGGSWKGLLRHMILCQLVMLFVAEQTTRRQKFTTAVGETADVEL